MLKISIPSDYRYDAICNVLQPCVPLVKVNEEYQIRVFSFSRQVKISERKLKSWVRNRIRSHTNTKTGGCKQLPFDLYHQVHFYRRYLFCHRFHATNRNR